MGDSWGSRLRLSIFGESHGPGVGVVVEGLPAGLPIDETSIAEFMARRAPGGGLGTRRKEPDRVELLSGVYKGRANGAAISCFIRNTGANSAEYDEIERVARPSHADYTAHLRYGGFNDSRGGGHFSGRLTAPLVCAGALCRMFLQEKGVRVGAHLLSMGPITDLRFDACGDASQLDVLEGREPRFLCEKNAEQARRLIEQLRETGDSVGAEIECAAFGVPAGLGEPFFGSVETAISSLLFSIPGVKAVAFGAGASFSCMSGSEANDQFGEGGSTLSNHSGGINGGISNGMPVVFTAAFRPTPSIARGQKGLNLQTRLPQNIEVKGRHDPCIAVRAVSVVEAVVWIALADCALAAGNMLNG